MAPPKATKTAAEKKPAKKTTKAPAGDKKKKTKRSKARRGAPQRASPVLAAWNGLLQPCAGPPPAC